LIMLGSTRDIGSYDLAKTIDMHFTVQKHI